MHASRLMEFWPPLFERKIKVVFISHSDYLMIAWSKVNFPLQLNVIYILGNHICQLEQTFRDSPKSNVNIECLNIYNKQQPQ